MTRIIAVANQKGGVGKTTTVINLGVALAKLKKKVLLVDLDPQGTLTVGLGINGDELEHTIYDAMLNAHIPAKQIITPIRAYLDLIPANSHLAAAEIELIPELRRELVLRKVLEPLNGWYDYILIDCPPSLSLLTVNAFCAANGVIIPMQCEYFAMRVIQLLLDSLARTKARLNPDLELTGILATMYSTGTVHAREVLEELRRAFGDKVFDVVIYKSIRFAEASVANKSIIEYAENHKGAKAYLKLAEQLVAQEQVES
ncbi:MAG: ParA family protein [Chloroflexi bacterium]|nr:MAG: ParA family protein [Chloroflexota bacterium]